MAMAGFPTTNAEWLSVSDHRRVGVLFEEAYVERIFLYVTGVGQASWSGNI